MAAPNAAAHSNSYISSTSP